MVIVTTGIARRWLQDDMIDASDVVIVDEQKANLGSRPATMSFRQIVVTPKPSDA